MWDRTGEKVEGQYLGIAISGTVTDSRVKYGGSVQHTIQLDTPIDVFGEMRDEVLVDSGDLA